VDKIEATYAYLQEQPSGKNTKLVSEIPPDFNCLNHHLVKLTEKMKLRKEEKIDCEMVLNIYFLTLFPLVKYYILFFSWLVSGWNSLNPAI